MFKKKAPARKEAIRFTRVYDGVRMKDSITAAPATITRKTLKDIKKSPKRYAWDQKKADGLFKSPNITINEFVEPEVDKENELDIIAEVKYTYTTESFKPSMSGFEKAFWLVVTFFFTSAIITAIFANNLAERSKIDAQCYYYTKEGVPNFVEIQGTKYYFDSDGAIDGLFVNPWHREVITSGNCVQVDTKKED